MGEQRVNGFAPAVDQVEHAFGQTGFFQQFNDENRAERNFFTRLEDESISAGQGGREHPHRHHGGKVERRNADTDPQGLIHRLAIDAAGQLFQRIAHQQGRDAAGILDILDPAISAAARFGQGLSVLPRNALADAIKILFKQLTVTEKQARSFDRWRITPGRERVSRGFHCLIHNVGAAQWNLRDGVAARGIKDWSCFYTGNFAPLAADEDGAGGQGRVTSDGG